MSSDRLTPFSPRALSDAPLFPLAYLLTSIAFVTTFWCTKFAVVFWYGEPLLLTQQGPYAWPANPNPPSQLVEATGVPTGVIPDTSLCAWLGANLVWLFLSTQASHLTWTTT